MALDFFLVITEVYEILFAFILQSKWKTLNMLFNIKYINYKMLWLICKNVKSTLFNKQSTEFE